MHPLVFISHTGMDGIKELFGWPTRWFLQDILRVQAFLDDGGSEPGRENMLAVMEPAYRCTHALVILSPNFRRRRFPVMELNTFIDRSTNEPAFKIIPALWSLSNAHGYNDSVDERSWTRSRYHDPASFLIKQLLPTLLRCLGRDETSETELTNHLLTYISSHRGTVTIPVDLENFFRRFSGNLVANLTEDANVMNPETSNETTSSSVFISHTFRVETTRVFTVELYNQLTARGVSCFLDRMSLPVGEHWERRIISEVTGCPVLVALLTSEFFRRHWCVKELDLAISLHHKIIPIFFEPMSLDMLASEEFRHDFFACHGRDATTVAWYDKTQRLSDYQAEFCAGSNAVPSQPLIEKIERLAREHRLNHEV